MGRLGVDQLVQVTSVGFKLGGRRLTKRRVSWDAVAYTLQWHFCATGNRAIGGPSVAGQGVRVALSSSLIHSYFQLSSLLIELEAP